MPASVWAIASEIRVRALWPTVVAGAVVAVLTVGALVRLAAEEGPQPVAPTDTPLAEALAYYSANGVASEGLYPFLAREPVYLAAQAPCDFATAYPGEAAALAVSEYRDGLLYYGFDSQASLRAWADDADTSHCFVSSTGGDLASLLIGTEAQPYLVMNIHAGLVLLTPDDLHAVVAIAGEVEL